MMILMIKVCVAIIRSCRCGSVVILEIRRRRSGLAGVTREMGVRIVNKTMLTSGEHCFFFLTWRRFFLGGGVLEGGNFEEET